MVRNSGRKIGLAPGTVIYTGDRKDIPVRIEVIDYTPEKYEVHAIKDVEDLKPFVSTKTVSWINVVGVHDSKVIERLGEIFSLDTLILEDIVNVHGRPKVEIRDGILFAQLKQIYYDKRNKLVFEQLSVILGKSFVITFQEEGDDVFEPVRNRIKGSHWRIRRLHSDYLFYALLDAVVDTYFSIMEQTGDTVDHIDDRVVKKSDDGNLEKIHSIKKDLVLLRKYIWPVREIVDRMKKTDTLILEDTHKFIDDLYDHVIQIIDSIEIYREITGTILETYLSNVSNKMNEIMKVLTVISTIFIPLTFITGLYGMNFQYMPELNWKYSYLIVWVIMAVISFLLFRYFHKKKWV